MSGMIRLRYDEVYSEMAELKNFVKEELDTIDARYAEIQSTLDAVDGSTNGVLKAAMESNRLKARAAGFTKLKLISFMENSSREIEFEELRVTDIFRAYVINIGW